MLSDCLCLCLAGALTFVVGMYLASVTNGQPGRCSVESSAAAPSLASSSQERSGLGNCSSSFVHSCDNHANRASVRGLKKGFITKYLSQLKHGNSPAKKDMFLTYNTVWSKSKRERSCSKVFVTGTGARKAQPKCVAIVVVKDGRQSMTHIQHRHGVTALKTNQFLKDYLKRESYEDEDRLLPPFLSHHREFVEQFQRKLGRGKVGRADRKTVVIMVVNEGVLDIFLNFICSAQGTKTDLSTFVIFTGNMNIVPLLESLGVHVFFHPELGVMPSKAADAYLDDTFKKMMWFKMASAYIASASGFHVLFQDVDLVWLADPIPYLRKLNADAVFMDDGARGTRYAPLYANSGFYFIKYNAKTKFLQELMLKNAAAEIGTFHSHQAVLSKHLYESMFLFDLKIRVVDKELFPSGKMYHDSKAYIARMMAHEEKPFVFHMCWTTNKHDKIVYFRNISMWYVSAAPACTNPAVMSASFASAPLVANCCNDKLYWSNYKRPS